MTTNEKYIPINCNYYDELELFALRKTNCKIVLLGEKEEETIQGLIQNLYTRKGEEFMLLNDGKEIRLDKIISVNGKISGSGSCKI